MQGIWIMALIHFVGMYLLMYSMVNVTENIYPNLNNFYMAGIMTAPMLIMEPFVMGRMHGNKISWIPVGLVGLIILLGGFIFIRQQALIYDREFIRSMIPHHSGAILMCRKAKLEDSELKDLCVRIIKSQQEEIDQTEEILKRL